MSQLQVTGEAKVRDIQGPVVANSGVITALDGDASQYVRGDGTLADFPTSTGGGSSVSYYLNSSVSQGTIGGVAYRQLSKTPISGAGTDITASTNGYIASYLTDANDPALLEVPAGNFNCEFYFSVNSNAHNPYVYAELYKYNGTTFTLLGSNQAIPEYLTNGTTLSAYYFAIPVAVAALTITDRLAIRIYVNVDGRVVTLHTENNHLCQVVTTFSKGLTSLNNLTRQVQFLGTGTSGTDFNIASSVATHTFNLPVASATNTGKLSSTDWSTFNNKQNALTNPITGTGASGNVAYFDGTTSITAENSFNYDASNNRLGVNTTVPNATIGANAGTDSGYSLLLKNDNANYNGIGFATTSTYGNVIGTEKLGTAPARNLTLLNQSGYISITEVGNLGVNILNPNTGLDIYNGTSAYLWLHTANSGITGTDGVRLALFSNNGANLRNFEGAMSITSEGDFQVITLGAENIRVNSADGKVGIGAPATVPEMLTVNGSIQQSGVLSALLKTNSSGKLIAAVAGTDYVVPSALSSYVPTSRELTINGTTYDLSANRSWTITADISGSGVDGRVAYWNGTNSITSEAGFIYDSSTNRLGVNTSVPNATIGADAALNSGYGLLIKTGASNYNGIGIAIDSTYGNTIEAARLGSAPSRNLTLLNVSGYVSLTETGAFGVGILNPNNGIDIYNSTQSQLWLHNAASGITGTDGVRLALFNNLSANLRNFDGALSLTAEGDFSIITIGTENFKVNSANGYVAIGGPATITSMLTVNGAITQSSVTSALLKTNASGTLVAAVAGTDYVTPSALSGYVPTSRTITINGTAFDLSADRSYSVGSVTSVGLSSATSGVTIGSSPVTSSGTITLAIATASGSQQGLLSSTDWTTFNNKASTAALANYLPLTGGTLTGALNGTSASFSSTLAAGDATFTNVAPILTIKSNTTGNVFLRLNQGVDVVSTMFYQNSSTSLTIANNIGELRFSTGGVSSAMVIANAGNVGIGTTTIGGRLDVQAAGTSAFSYYFRNSSGGYGGGIYNTGGNNTQLYLATSAGTENVLLSSSGVSYFNGGNVGIGTSSPARPLTVMSYLNDGAISSGGDMYSNAYFGNGGIMIGTQSTTGNGVFMMNTNKDTIFGNWNGSTNAERMRITSGGNVQINNNLAIGRSEENGVRLSVTTSTNGSDAYGVIVRQLSGQDLFVVRNDGLWITGNRSLSPYNNSISGRTIVADSSGTLGYTSSTRESKINIEKLNDVSWLYQLNPVSFNYRKKDNEMNYTDEAQNDKYYGLIADEVEKINENLVFYNIKEDGTKQLAGVEYSKLIAALIKSSQEQQAQIEELSNKIVALESK